MLVDSHCHLDFPDFAQEGVSAIIERARSLGVTGFLTISTRLRGFQAIQDIARQFDDVWQTVGVHPLNVAEQGEAAATTQDIIKYCAEDKVVGIGESGLDYHYTTEHKDLQSQVFRRHIQAALETGLPLVIHAREADDDIMKIIEEEDPRGNLRGVLHCYSSGRTLAEWGWARGLHLGFTGILTFKNARTVQEIAAQVPLNKLLVETDCPYLAPMPYRGKRNEPAFVVEVAKKLAELRDLTYAEICKITTTNFTRLFGVKCLGA